MPENQVNIEQEIRIFMDSLTGLDEYRLPQRAHHIIRLAIRDLILPPGKEILEREMVEALQMSRTPVREALVRLETEGIVRLIPRRGFKVETIEKEDLKEIFEIVRALDGLAVEIATKKINDTETFHLESLINQQEEALQQKDLKRWSILDDQFHHFIINSAKNKRLNAVIDSHSDQLYRARLFTIKYRPLPLLSIVEHRAILSCMKARDGAAAHTVMQTHRSRSNGEILTALDELNHLHT